MPEKKLKIKVQGHEISVIAYENQDDYISLTDIAKQKILMIVNDKLELTVSDK